MMSNCFKGTLCGHWTQSDNPKNIFKAKSCSQLETRNTVSPSIHILVTEKQEKVL